MPLNHIISKHYPILNSLGQPVAGGSIYLREPGSTDTFIQSFKDSGLLTENDQPVKLSGSGRASIWINRDCDIRIEDRFGNLILTDDNINPDDIGTTSQGQLISNASFETDTDADGTPDSWTLTSETGANNAQDTSESTEGLASFRFTSTGNGGGSLTTTNFFPVNGSDNLRVNFDIRATVAAVKNIVRVEWYDASEVFISNTDVYDSITNPTVFTSFDFQASPPVTARFAKLKLIGIDPSVLLSGSTYFDNIEVFYPVAVSGIFDNIEIRNNEIITLDTDGDLDLNPNGAGLLTFKGNAKFSKGTDLGTADVTAGILTVGSDGDYFDFVDTDTISGIASVGVGSTVKIHFDDSLQLTHHATDFILPGGANITTAAGDEAEFIEYASGDWRLVSYQYNEPSQFRGALVYAGSAETLTTSAYKHLAFNTEAYDTDDIHDTVTNNNRLTVPAGVTKVKLWGQVLFAANATGIRNVLISKNDDNATPAGAPGLPSLQISATPSLGCTINVSSTVIEVIGGDFFTLAALQSSGGNLNTATVSNGFRTSFAMEIIE